MPRLLLLAVLLILYGSLYPWDFHSRALDASVPAILMRSWPGLDRFFVRDVLVNVLIYIPLGAAAFLSYRRRCGAWTSAALAAATGLALSTAIEIAQIWDRTRTPSAFDICCNTAGTTIGTWLASVIRRDGRILSIGRSGTRSPAAAGLLALWVVHQLYPLFPSFSSYGLAARLRRLVHGRWTWPDVFTEAAAWIAVAVLAKAVAGKRARLVYLPLLLLAPARLLVAGSGPSVAHFLGAAAALAVALAAWRRLTPKLGTALLLASIGVRELMPFHFGPRNPHGFAWVPFAATLGGDWSSALAIILRKSIDYGMAVWMLWAAGAGWIGAAGLVAAVLAAGEAMQLWLPGRSPEIADPVLAILMAFVLWTLQRERARRSSR